MKRTLKTSSILAIGVLTVLTIVLVAYAWTPIPVADDPLVRMPGTQPDNGVSLESPNRCLNCHAGYNESVEPGFNWQGSMMAQASRDFMFWAAMTVAGQDAVWAVGNPNATDLCLRCHFPKGWLEGRSDPTNASLMVGADYDGVQCDFCHRMYDPFFESTHNGTREAGHDWDEAPGGDSAQAAAQTHAEDSALAQAIRIFNGQPFFDNNNLPPINYTENTSGQYFVSTDAAKRASFQDADARHQMLYSRYHKSKYFCGTCHDVSNPVLANLGADPSQTLPSETNSAFSYFHVERTFSEFMLSAYGQEGGAAGIGPFAPAVYETSNAANNIAMCQDCHMRDVVGTGANKKGTVVRPDGSIEHPESGQPLHDLTGGNVWVSTVLASAVQGSPNFDQINYDLLNQGPSVLTLDLTQGQGIDPVALLAGADRAKQQLELAASINNLTYDSATGALSFQVQNQTGHRLISGFPEGRRMFVNVKAYNGDDLVYEVNPYDYGVGTLKGLPHSASSPSLGPNEVYVDELVYEMHPSSTLTGEAETLHFVLANGRYKDNRIPPRGFDIGGATARQAEPVMYGNPDPSYFTAAEYASGYDEVSLAIPAEADAVKVNLYYQTTSREYIEFLRDEINGTTNVQTLPESAYIIQTDPFFAQLKAWGDTIWQLWLHNKDDPGAAPYLMAQAAVGDTGGGGACGAPTPTILSAVPGNKEVALTWTNEHSGNTEVVGYSLYYDQAGKAQLVADLGLVTSYLDTNLTNGQQYCYEVTSRYANCESAFSTIVCTTPTSQTTLLAGVASLQTGYYTGKGGNTTWNLEDTFTQGDEVVILATVLDEAGTPVPNATVEITITGPETTVLTSGPSDADGIAEITWKTKAPKGKQAGTLPGEYTASVSNITADGYDWDGVMTALVFTIIE